MKQTYRVYARQAVFAAYELLRQRASFSTTAKFSDLSFFLDFLEPFEEAKKTDECMSALLLHTCLKRYSPKVHSEILFDSHFSQVLLYSSSYLLGLVLTEFTVSTNRIRHWRLGGTNERRRGEFGSYFWRE